MHPSIQPKWLKPHVSNFCIGCTPTTINPVLTRGLFEALLVLAELRVGFCLKPASIREK